MFDVNERAQRRSALLNIISGPVDSSFRQIGGYKYESTFEAPAAVQRSNTLSGVSSNFSAIPSRKVRRGDEKAASAGDDNVIDLRPPSLASEKSKTPTLTVDTRNLRKPDGQRVIVRYRTGRAPTLEFTQLAEVKALKSIPSPTSRRLSQRRNSDSSLHSKFSVASSEAPKSAFFPSSAYLDHQQTEPYPTAFTDSPVVRIGAGVGLPDRRHIRPQSRRTLQDNTELKDRNARKSSIVLPRQTYDGSAPDQKQLALLHALAMRSISADAISVKSYAASDEVTLTGTSSASVSRAQSQRTVTSRTSLLRRGSSRRKPVPAYDDLDSAAVDEAFALADDLEAREQEAETEARTGRRTFAGPFSAPGSHATFLLNGTKGGRVDPRRYTAPDPQSDVAAPVPQVMSAPGSKVEFAWMRSSVGFRREEIEELNAAWKEIGAQRVRSVVSSVRQFTPTPSENMFSRDSMVVERSDRGDGTSSMV